MAVNRPRRAVIAALTDRLSRIGTSPAAGIGAGTPVSAVPLGLAAIDRGFKAGGLPGAAVHELWAGEPGAHPMAAGFALALAGIVARARRGTRGDGDLVWIYLRGQTREHGLAYGPGLMAFGHDPGRIILVEARRTLEALWAGEEALRAACPAGVVIAVGGTYGRHAFMASRRLELAARASGVSAFVLCAGDEAPASASSLRWRVWPRPCAAAAGHPAPFPARPRWRIALERNRLGRCGIWNVEWNHESGTLQGAGADAGAVAAALGGRAGAGETARAARYAAA